MATKAKRRSNMPKDPNSTKKIRKQSQRKKDHHVQNPMAVDDVIHQILPLLPTKSAVRMSSLSKQWQAVWFSLSVLDFDEGDPAHDSDNKLEKLQHTNFINILDRYCRNAKSKKLLEKFRLRMTTFSIVRDSVVVNKCLSFAVGRSLKELNISLRPKHRPFLCCLSLQTLLDAKSLTTLSLEFVRIKVDDNTSYNLETLPSLKSLSLKSVQLISEALSLLVSGCPSIEYLSLCSCSSFHGSMILQLEVSSVAKSLTTLNLEFLKVKVDCNTSDDLEIFPSLKTMSLESVQLTSKTLSSFISGCPSIEYLSLSACSNFNGSEMLQLEVSSSSLKSLYITNCSCHDINIFNCRNLKYINIRTHRLCCLRLWSCGNSVKETTIDIPQCLEQADIHLLDEEAAFKETMEYFSALRDYLAYFKACKKLFLHVGDAGALIFPENFRNTSSPPVPCLLNLQVRIESPKDARDSDLRDALKWMARSPLIETIQYQNEE